MKIASIFLTVDGEVTYNGPWHWSVFIRLGGCNLRCWKSSGFCDAPHTLDINYPYKDWDLEDLVSEVRKFRGVRRCTITGGEPLLQDKDLVELCYVLCSTHLLTCETSGSLLLHANHFDVFHSVIMDVKPPSTEMEKKNCIPNMALLRRQDFAKFVLENYRDFYWALEFLEKNPTKAQVAFGARWGKPFTTRHVAEALRENERFDIMLNMQTHKYIWETQEKSLETLKGLDHEMYVAKEV